MAKVIWRRSLLILVNSNLKVTFALQRHEALMITAYKVALTVKGEVWKPNPNLMQRN